MKGASKVVPVVGGAVSGGLTYATFKPNCMRLKRSLWDLEICDVGFYEKGEVTSTKAMDEAYQAGVNA